MIAIFFFYFRPSLTDLYNSMPFFPPKMGEIIEKAKMGFKNTTDKTEGKIEGPNEGTIEDTIGDNESGEGKRKQC